MKKIIALFLFLFSLTTLLYSQEINEKQGRKVLEQIRKEIQAEEKAKEKAIKEAEKAKIVVEREEFKKGKKIIEEIKRDINESLEEKVFRSENTSEARMTAFEIGKDRISFLKAEEEEIIKLEEALGIENDSKGKFLGQQFDEVYNKFKNNNNEIELLLLENKKLNEYLSRLDKMEQKVKAGN